MTLQSLYINVLYLLLSIPNQLSRVYATRPTNMCLILWWGQSRDENILCPYLKAASVLESWLRFGCQKPMQKDSFNILQGVLIFMITSLHNYVKHPDVFQNVYWHLLTITILKVPVINCIVRTLSFAAFFKAGKQLLQAEHMNKLGKNFYMRII